MTLMPLAEMTRMARCLRTSRVLQRYLDGELDDLSAAACTRRPAVPGSVRTGRTAAPEPGGCGHVFDDVELFDAHCDHGACTDPRTLDLVSTKNGIWLRCMCRKVRT